MPGRQHGKAALFGAAGTGAAHEGFLALIGQADPESFGILWLKATLALAPSISNQRRLWRPAETRLTVNDASVPAPVLNIAAATSSLVTACIALAAVGVLKLCPLTAPRSAITVENAAFTSAKPSPLTHSTRSHQCEPMSANTRDVPPSAGSTRQLLLAGSSSQSCR